MPVIIVVGVVAAIIVAAFIAVSVLGFALHFLFSPLVLVLLAVLAWVKFRPRRTR